MSTQSTWIYIRRLMFCKSIMLRQGMNLGGLYKTYDFPCENLVEHLTFNQVVLGSSPSRPTKTPLESGV